MTEEPDVEGFLSAAGWDGPIKRANNPMDETEFYDYVTQGPRPHPKKAITLHRAIEEGEFYVLAGEVLAVERSINTSNFNRVEQTRIWVSGFSFLVKETADEVLRLLGWEV